MPVRGEVSCAPGKAVQSAKLQATIVDTRVLDRIVDTERVVKVIVVKRVCCLAALVS